MINSMHIIGSRQMGGAEAFFERLLRALEDKGHAVSALLRPSSPLVSKLNNIAQFHIGMRNGWDVFSVLKIKRIIRKTRPDVVQTYMGRATRLTRVPAESPTIHVARLGGYYKIKGYYEHADAWVGNTKRLCDYLVKSGLPIDRIYQIGNFVEKKINPSQAEVEGFRNSLGIPKNASVLFSLGRFNYKKGFEDLLQAFAILISRYKHESVYLVIAGDGELKSNLHSLARDLRLEQGVLWVGWQPDPSMFYASADIFVCPSRIETMGNVILEAWAYGLPVVATQTPGALELIEHGTNGILVPINSPEALAREISVLLKAGALLWHQLGSSGRQTLTKNYSREKIVAQYLAMYEELLNRKGPLRLRS